MWKTIPEMCSYTAEFHNLIYCWQGVQLPYFPCFDIHVQYCSDGQADFSVFLLLLQDFFTLKWLMVAQPHPTIQWAHVSTRRLIYCMYYGSQNFSHFSVNTWSNVSTGRLSIATKNSSTILWTQNTPTRNISCYVLAEPVIGHRYSFLSVWPTEQSWIFI